MLVLKRLSDALRDGDRIYATIDGIATNNDGRGDGPMAPLLEGQRDVIEGAWKDAGTAIEELGYEARQRDVFYQLIDRETEQRAIEANRNRQPKQLVELSAT